MKTLYTLLATCFIVNISFAKTYTAGSGKWTDARIWNNDYPGTTIQSSDIVIVTGQVTMNTGIVVEGTLQVNKGAFMVGMKDLVIARSGKFVNDGNTVMKRIVNEGSINNNMIMEAMNDVDNKGEINNNSNMVAGNDFENVGGNAKGNGGAYFVSNNILTSPASKFGDNVKAFYGDKIEKSMEPVRNTTSLLLDIRLENGIRLNVSNPEKLDVSLFSIEKSSDGKNFTLIATISGNGSSAAMTYLDSKINSEFAYYRVKAIDMNGKEIVLPVATVKLPADYSAYTLANE